MAESLKEGTLPLGKDQEESPGRGPGLSGSECPAFQGAQKSRDCVPADFAVLCPLVCGNSLDIQFPGQLGMGKRGGVYNC